MEFKYRAVDKEPTPYSSPYSVEEMEQDQGHFPIHDILRGAIQSEPEMKKIRKVIHDAETARKAIVLGDKRSREIIIERGLASRERGGDETGMFHMETGVGLKGRGLTFAEERSLEERIYKKVEERFAASFEKKIAASLEKRFAMSLDRLLKANAPGDHTSVPFGQLSLEKIGEVALPPNEAEREEKQIVVMELPNANRRGEKMKAVQPVRQGANESISEFAKKMAKNDANRCGEKRKAVQPVRQGANESTSEIAKKMAEKALLQELPDANRCGEKRKAVQPLRQGANESTSEMAKKMAKKAWTCGLCQVSTTSKDDLANHVQGKKHKLKEAASKLQNEVKDIDNGLLRPNKKAKGDADVSGIKLKDVSPQEQAASEYKKSGDPNKTAIGFWNCELCQVSLTSKHVFDDHMQGKKHKSKEAALKELDTERKHLNDSIPQKEAEQNEISLLQGCEKIDWRGNNTSEDDFKSSQREKEGFLFWCKTCNVEANSEVAMEIHRKGRKHVNKSRKAVPLPTTKILNNVVASNVDDPTKDGEVDLCGNVDVAAVVEMEAGVGVGVGVKVGDNDLDVKALDEELKI